MPHDLEAAPGLETVSGLPLLYYRRGNALIIADVHLGFEDAMASKGVFLPRIQLSKALETLSRAVEITGAKRLFINGDLKHVFEKLTRQEREEIPRFIEGARSLGIGEVVLVRGNHDTFISGILQGMGVDVVDDYLDLGGIVLTHGHRSLSVEAEYIVIGHEHPVLQVSIGGTKVRFPVVLRVPLSGGGEAIVLPAFGVYQSGNPVTLEPRNYLSDIVKERGLVEEAIPIVVEPGVGSMTLPPLRELLASMPA